MTTDCSQTLYEFRASNPKALNILEGSGVFKIYKLSINYRSNQEILDFANILLQQIEANQYAHIQLTANSMAKVTEQSFLSKVHLNYHRLNKLSDWENQMGGIMSTQIKPYLDSCIANGKQVAFLAFRRHDIETIKAVLKAMYPNMIADDDPMFKNPNCTVNPDIISLIPNRTKSNTTMSDFIRKDWSHVNFFPATNIVNIIINEIISRKVSRANNSSTYTSATTRMLMQTKSYLQKWAAENQVVINQWASQLQRNQITNARFLDLVKQNMIRYEIKSNAIRESLISAGNTDRKTADTSSAKFLLSTIHSAKGLEFDNVVILFKNSPTLTEEEKRMYYVAFTRAMESEYILAYGTQASPSIETDYLTVINDLHKIAPSIASPLNKVDKKDKLIV